MFSYCWNNSINYDEPSGKAPSLRIFIDLHNAVLKATQEYLLRKGIITTTQVATYSTKNSIFPNGFMDIFSLNTKEVWEVKRNNSRGINAGYKQLSRYTMSYVKKGFKDPIRPILGSRAFWGHIYLSEGIYDITAYCDGALILYNYKINVTRAALAGVVIVGGALIFASTGLPVPGWAAAFA